MAESSLSLGYPDFQARLGYYLGYGRTPGNWSSDQTTDVEDCIQGGLRLFYNPVDIPAVPRHEWKFMRPIGVLPIYPSVPIVSASWVGGVATLTITTPSILPVGGVAVVQGLMTADGSATSGYCGSFTITASTSTTITYALTANPGATSGTGTVGVNDYTAPDDFGGIDGDMTFASQDNARMTVAVVSEEVIRRYRQSYVNVTARPKYVSITPTYPLGSAGQRFFFSFWPNIDGAYTLSFRYRALLGKLTAALPFPAGGMAHAETILACMLGYAERYINDMMQGEKWQYMIERLKTSMNNERTGMVPEFFGYNGDSSDQLGMERFARTINVTYKGVQY